MGIMLHHHLSVAWQAALFAFKRSCRNGESLDEILGYTDALTGIPNRKAFDEDRPQVHVFETFVLVDVDNLKQLNDTFGHIFGDQILCSCADILDEATTKVGKAYRLAGDEFALIVPQCWVKTVCLYIRSRVGKDARFTISMGIAPPCGAEGLTDGLFSAAETALYQCKNRDPDRFDEYLVDAVAKTASPYDLYMDESCIRRPSPVATAA
ncbi:MAG: GGDEF domain-containing protein [Chitinispirillaceae bacterium]|nr:GGDEF domain-containing protein [Chitinispirillaceae bacterium]